MIYRIDADLNGTDSIQPWIDAGKVTNLDAYTFAEFQDRVNWLCANANPATDRVVLDAVNTLTAATRTDLKFGNEDADLWAERHKYFGDKNSLNIYQAATSVTMRYLRNLRARKFRLTTIVHSGVKDEMGGDDENLLRESPQLGLDLNKELREWIRRSSSDVLFMTMLNQDELWDKGPKVGEVRYEKGTHLLYLQNDGTFDTKIQVAADHFAKVPRRIIEPTMQKIRRALQKDPSWLTVYGGAGVGKTTLACSDAKADTEQTEQDTPIDTTTQKKAAK